jgi:hypothetical protein
MMILRSDPRLMMIIHPLKGEWIIIINQTSKRLSDKETPRMRGTINHL